MKFHSRYQPTFLLFHFFVQGLGRSSKSKAAAAAAAAADANVGKVWAISRNEASFYCHFNSVFTTWLMAGGPQCTSAQMAARVLRLLSHISALGSFARLIMELIQLEVR